MDVFITSVKFVNDVIQIHALRDDETATPVLIVVRDFLYMVYIEKKDVYPQCPPYKVVTKTDGYGFHEPAAFAEFAFSSIHEFHKMRLDCKSRGIVTYNTFLDPVEQFMMTKNIYGALWVHIDHATDLKTDMIPTLECKADAIHSMPEVKKYPKRLRISSFDIESVKNQCIQITTINYVLNENCQEITSETKVYAQTMRTSRPIPGVEVLCYGDTPLSRANLLRAWRDIINTFDPDIIMGHNIKNYDIPELLKNAARCGILPSFSFSRPVYNPRTQKTVRPDVTAQERERGGSKQSGYRQQTDITCTRIVMDTYEVMLLGMEKYESYKLDFLTKACIKKDYTKKYACQSILGLGKKDVTYDQIEPMYNGTLEERSLLLEYNVQDSVLPFEMMMALKKINGMIELARAGKVMIDWVFGRGVECKAFSLSVEAAYCRGFIFPHLYKEVPEDERENLNAVYKNDSERAVAEAKRRAAREKRLKEEKKEAEVRYSGATVIATKTGIYNELMHRGELIRAYITTLDYASLYPSIIRGYNLCFTTWVKPEDVERVKIKFDLILTSHGDYFIDYHLDEIDERRAARDAKLQAIAQRLSNGDLAEVCEAERISVTQEFDMYMSRRRRGVAPEILDLLVSQRSDTKKEQKKYTELDPEYGILEERQLAIKLVGNGYYGALGSPTFKIPCLPVAASVTKYGQDGLKITEAIARAQYPDLELIAGDTDSLMLLLKIHGSLKDTMEAGMALAKLITKSMHRRPMEIAWEKVLHPAVFPSQLEEKREVGQRDDDIRGVKKNYYARKLMHWTDVEVDYSNPKSVEAYNKRLMIKGVGVVRRNFCKYARTVGRRICEIMVMEPQGGVEAALAYVVEIEKELQQMAQRKNPKYVDLKIYRNNGKDEYDVEMNAVVRLIELNNQRGGEPIKLGDRIPHYIINNGYDRKKLAMKVEHASYVENMDNTVVIDVDYYKRKQLRNLIKMLIPFHEEEVDKALFPNERMVKKVKKLTSCATTKIKDETRQQQDIFSFVSKVDIHAQAAKYVVPSPPLPSAVAIKRDVPESVAEEEKKIEPSPKKQKMEESKKRSRLMEAKETVTVPVKVAKTVTLLDFFQKK